MTDVVVRSERRERIFSLIPATLAWSTIVAMFVFSWLIPTYVAIFIILFDTYWLLKSVYLSFHLRVTYKELRKNVATDWIARLHQLSSTEITVPRVSDVMGMHHLVILPMYREPYALVRESMQKIANSSYPLKQLLVVLALEEAAGDEAQETGRRLQEEFGRQFGAFLVTTHPRNLEGEIPGKGSNESWAGQQAVRELIDARHIPYEHVLVSVFDIDTQIEAGYFARLTHAYLTADKPLRRIYQPIPFFTNNVYESPALARVIAFSCTFWQMMQQARSERLTSFSSQSAPLQLLVDVGFWHRDVVSEDSRIFWQAFFRYDGDFSVYPLMYPVAMDANVVPSFWGTMVNLYKQQRRWGWGSENIPYMFSGFWNNTKIAFRTKAYWAFTVLEGFHSWATNSLMIFLLGWLPLWLGSEAFNKSLLSYNLPIITRTIITLSMLGIVSSAIMAIILLPPRPKWFKRRHYALYLLQWALLPITLIIFGAFPGLEAQTRLALGGRWRLGFWVTPKTRGAEVG